MVGVLDIKDALDLAHKAELDLVEVSPTASPPVCKILDFGKYKYESKKKLVDAKKKQKTISIKEMKFKLNIGQGDFDTKLRKISAFIEDGDKVKISLWLKGREIMHSDLGMKLFEKIIHALGDTIKIDSQAKMEGKNIIMTISPK